MIPDGVRPRCWWGRSLEWLLFGFLDTGGEREYNKFFSGDFDILLFGGEKGDLLFKRDGLCWRKMESWFLGANCKRSVTFGRRASGYVAYRFRAAHVSL